MNVQIYIERLILDGLPLERGQSSRIQTAVEVELARLIAENGLAAHLRMGGAMPSLNANAIQLMPDSSPRQIGTQIAQSVYSGIGNL